MKILLSIGIILFSSIFEVLGNSMTSCDSLFDIAYSHFKAQEWTESKKFFLAYEKCGHRNSVLYFSLGRCYLATGKYDSAIFYFNIAETQYKSNYYWTFGNRGIAYKELKQFERAAKDLNKAISMFEEEILPADKDAWKLYRERAWLFVALKKYDAAIADLELAIEENPDSMLAYTELCEVLTINGDYQRVVDLEGTILALKPDDGHLAVYRFYRYCGIVLQGKDAKIDEEKLKSQLNKPHVIEWYFNDFNEMLLSKGINSKVVNAIKNYEVLISSAKKG